MAHAVRATRAVLDGEIVCLRPDGLSDFYSLPFRCEWPYFYAFDLLSLDGKDLRRLPLTKRKRRLAAIMPRVESRVRYVDHLARRGRDLFRLVCERDAEGIVAKWARGPYHSQAAGRHEFFEETHPRSRPLMPARRLDPLALAAARANARRPVPPSWAHHAACIVVPPVLDTGAVEHLPARLLDPVEQPAVGSDSGESFSYRGACPRSADPL
jgi:hypothetical protein